MMKSKSQIFREAWARARQSASHFGGKAREYLGACLRMIYAELRKVRQEVATYVRKENAIKTGVYSAMIAANTPSTNLVSTAVDTVRAAASAAVAKVTSLKARVSGFIRSTFNFNRHEEVALE